MHILSCIYELQYRKSLGFYCLCYGWTLPGCITIDRVPTAPGKQGKWPKKIPVAEKTGNLEILPKHRKHREFGLLKL